MFILCKCELHVPVFIRTTKYKDFYSTSKLSSSSDVIGMFVFFLGSFIHQRIKQEQKSYAYCEVDNIRCKFDKCTKFFFLLSGVLCITSRGDSRPPTDFIRFFSERTASSLRICQDVHYIPFRWFSVRVFVFFYTLLWLLMLISFLFLMRFLQLKSETQGNELYSKYFHLNTCYSIVIWLNYSTLHTFLNIYIIPYL